MRKFNYINQYSTSMFLLSVRILVNRKERMKKRRGDDQIIRDNAADNMTIPHVHILR